MNWYLKCLKQYADLSGRARRKEYWMFYLFNTIIGVALMCIDSITGLGVLYTLYMLAVLVPGLAVCVRRLHDLGKSGWWILICLIPLAGLILLYWSCKEGQRTTNQWGADPKFGEA